MKNAQASSPLHQSDKCTRWGRDQLMNIPHYRLVYVQVYQLHDRSLSHKNPSHLHHNYHNPRQQT